MLSQILEPGKERGRVDAVDAASQVQKWMKTWDLAIDAQDKSRRQYCLSVSGWSRWMSKDYPNIGPSASTLADMDLTDARTKMVANKEAV